MCDIVERQCLFQIEYECMIDCTQVRGITPQFYEGVEEFMTACGQIEQFIRERTVRFPCAKCKCRRILDINPLDIICTRMVLS